MRRTLKSLLLAVLTVSLIAGTAVTASASKSVSKIDISKKSATVYVGETVTLKVTGTEKKVTWSSSNKKVATVSSSGKVTGKKAGTATVTAKVSGKKLKCSVKVKKKGKIHLSKTSLTLHVDRYQTLKVEGTSKDVEWSTSDEKIATVSDAGKVVGKKAGTATITAKVSGKKLKCKVKVKNVLKVDKKKVTISGKKTAKVKVTLNKLATVTCKSSDGSIADCKWDSKWDEWKDGKTSTNLNITGKKNGTMTLKITNNYNSETYEIEVTVKDIDE